MSVQLITDPENRKAIVSIKMITPFTNTGIRKGFYYLGKDLVSESKKLIRKKPKHGRVYKIKKVILGKNPRVVMRRHVASAPGEAPARITGALLNSLDFDVSGADRMEFGSKRNTHFIQKAIGVGFTVKGKKQIEIEYPKLLEEGTRKMAKRPYLLPSIKNNERNAREHFTREIKKAFKKGKP